MVLVASKEFEKDVAEVKRRYEEYPSSLSVSFVVRGPTPPQVRVEDVNELLNCITFSLEQLEAKYLTVHAAVLFKGEEAEHCYHFGHLKDKGFRFPRQQIQETIADIMRPRWTPVDFQWDDQVEGAVRRDPGRSSTCTLQ